MNCGAYSTVAKKTADISSTARQAERNSMLRNTSAGTRALSLIRGSIRANATMRRRRDGEHRDHAGVAEAPVGGLVEGEQHQQQPGRQRDDARVVDPLILHLRSRLMDLEPGDEDGEGRDRDVEEEDPAPAQLVGEHPAEQRAHRVADPGGAQDQPTRQPGLRLRQGRVGHAEDRRPDQRAADPHAHPGGDQPRRVLGYPAQQREAGEQGAADEEGAAAPEQVGEPPAGDDRHPEHEAVGVDHPLRGADVDVEVLLDRRQGDVQRREVVGDHDHAEAHRDQGHRRARLDPVGVACGRAGHRSSSANSRGSLVQMPSTPRAASRRISARIVHGPGDQLEARRRGRRGPGER